MLPSICHGACLCHGDTASYCDILSCLPHQSADFLRAKDSCLPPLVSGIAAGPWLLLWINFTFQNLFFIPQMVDLNYYILTFDSFNVKGGFLLTLSPYPHSTGPPFFAASFLWSPLISIFGTFHPFISCLLLQYFVYFSIIILIALGWDLVNCSSIFFPLGLWTICG